MEKFHFWKSSRVSFDPHTLHATRSNWERFCGGTGSLDMESQRLTQGYEAPAPLPILHYLGCRQRATTCASPCHHTRLADSRTYPRRVICPRDEAMEGPR